MMTFHLMLLKSSHLCVQANAVRTFIHWLQCGTD